MYLKSLELQGFKSFLEKTRLDFEHGITVIVGPNGCGKSNIADAIRWVLGEQSSKTLRGNKMEDVIFVGSEKRKPVGLAEVTITLDNTSGTLPLEYKEVAITRKIFRLGDSEYFVNKSSCRLKDILDLFADSGIGKESMNLVSQGKVEEVLNARPEERRALIEEVAGIIKYRNRKKEVLRKLEDTQGSLSRLQDLTAELQRQLLPLAAEAEIAHKYQLLKTELDELELCHYLNQLKSIKQRLDAASQNLTQKQNDLLAAEIINSELLAKTSARQSELERSEKQMRNSLDSLYDCLKRLERLEGQIGIVEEQKKSTIELKQRLQFSMAAVQEKLTGWQSQHIRQESSYEKLLAQLETEKSALNGYLAELSREETSLKKYHTDLEHSKYHLYELASRLAGLRNEDLQLSQQRRQVETKEQRIREKNQGLITEIKQAEGYRLECLERARQTQQRLEEVISLQREVCARKQEKLAETNELKRKMQYFEQEFNRLNSRMTFLQEMLKEKDGLFQGVKTILQARQQKNPVCLEVYGVVADIIKVPKELEIAVEVSLGSALQDIVVETDRAAKTCIQFLKEEKGGRATFLPLNTIKSKNLPLQAKSLLGQPGVVGIASQLANTEAKFQLVLDHLLGNLLVVQDIEVGIKVAALSGYNIRIVTLEGELLNPGGALTGGSLRSKRINLLSRNRELNETAIKLEEQTKALAEIKTSLTKAEAAYLLETAELDRLQAEFRQLELTAANNEKEADRQQEFLNRLCIETGALEIEEKELAVELAGIASRLKIVRQMLVQAELEETKLKKEIEQMQIEERAIQAASKSLSETVTKTKVKLARLQQEELGLKDGLQHYYQMKENYLAELAGLKKESEETSHRLAEKIKHLLICQEDRSLLMLSKEALEQEVAIQRESLASCKERLENLEVESRQAYQNLVELKNLVHQKELEKIRLESEFRSGNEMLLDKWQIEYNVALCRKPKHLPSGSFGQRIKELQVELSGLGPVNLGAIMECQRLQERLSFLCDQKNDLEEAKTMLLQVIREMDQVIAKRFSITFHKVADFFAKTFCSLFGGGYACLSLTEPDNLLETGIEISAQPPGKKLQNLNMLSGGERALTTIALLFAVLYAKPSPFCVLDEIDASLDETNVERFAFFLKELSQSTQFILISHRQGTMVTANRLYGVSMEEPGISKLISVKLADGGIGQAS